MTITLIVVFLLNIFSTAIGTLKTIFLTKGISKPAYLLTFVDSVLFTWGMKLVVTGEGHLFLIVYAVGKTLGVWIGDVTEKKLALGTLEVTIMAKQEKAIRIADYLRSLGYTVNTRQVFGIGGEEKYDICLFIQRKEYAFLKESLDRLGIHNVSMVVTDVNKVTGKIKTQHTVNIN